MDSRIHMGSNMLVAGPTNCGKTTFVLKLLDAMAQLFDIKPERVYWFYGVKTDEHDLLVARNYNVYEGIPRDFNFIRPNSVVVLDDLMRDAGTNPRVTELVTGYAHHKPCFVINIVQNLFFRSPELRTQNLNSQYKVLFPNAQAPGQIKILANQMFPTHTRVLLDAFVDPRRRPYGYLLLDFHQKTAELIRLRTNILPDEAPQIVYMDKRLYAETYPARLLHGGI